MSEWLPILQGASFVGLLIVTTVAGLQRGQVQNLKAGLDGVRGDRDDEKARVEARDATLAEERAANLAERAKDRARIAELESAVDVLRQTVTGEAHLVALEGAVADLTELLTKHHTDALAGLDRLYQALAGLEDAVREANKR